MVGAATVAAGVIVELERTGATVEQRSTAPTGVALSPCSNDASTQWYFADGVSVDGVTYSLLLTNPYPDSAVVDISLVTATGLANPTELQGYVVPPRSISTIDISGSFARDEEQLSIAVQSRRGRVIAAKSQTFNGGRRLGYAVMLGSPSVGDQWFFADGESGTGIDERYSIFNPTSEAIDVDVVFLPIDDAPELAPVTLTIDSEDTVLIDVAEVEGLPEGRHSASIRTFSTAAVVVERALTRPAGRGVATSVVLGSRFGSPSWWLPTGVPTPTPGAIVVQNATNLDGTFTVSSLGPGGLAPITGLTDLALAAGGVVAVDLTATDAVGDTLLVSSADRPADRRAASPAGRSAGPGWRPRRAGVTDASAADRTPPGGGGGAWPHWSDGDRFPTRRPRPDRPRCRSSSTGPTSNGPMPHGSSRCSRRPRARRALSCSTRPRVVACRDVAVQDVEYTALRRLHERYGIDAVPMVVVADADGVVRASFVGPMSATDLWAAVAEVRNPGSSPEPGLGRDLS